MTNRASIEIHTLQNGSIHISTPSGRSFRVSVKAEDLWRQIKLHERGKETDPRFKELLHILENSGVFPCEETTQIIRVAALDPDRVLQNITQKTNATIISNESRISVELMDRDEPSMENFDCLLGIFPRYQWREIYRTERMCKQVGIPYIFLHFEANSAYFGPYVSPGDAVSYIDLHERRWCAVRNITDLRMSMEEPQRGRFQIPLSDLSWCVDKVLHEIGRSQREGHSWHEIEMQLNSHSIKRHAVFPMPHKDDNSENYPKLSPQDLVSPRVGIVTKLERVNFHTAAAEGLNASQSWCADMRRVLGRDSSAVNAGFSFHSKEEADLISIAESVERYCASITDPRRLTRSTQNGLKSAGYNVIDISRFALFSPNQYKDNRIPYSAIHPDEEIEWTIAHQVSSGSPFLAPSSLVYLNWNAGENIALPQHHPLNFAGVSAGANWDSALTNALEEIVERDAMMAWWLTGNKLPEVSAPIELAEHLDSLSQQDYRCWFLKIPHPTGIPVVAAVIDHIEEKILTVGFASRNNHKKAALKAWTEAVALLETALDLQRENGLIWGKKGQQRLGTIGLAPHRQDRSYNLDYANDFSDVTNLFAQLQVNLDPKIRSRCLEFLEPEGKYQSESTFERNSREMCTRIQESGFDVYTVDLTTPDVASTGLCVLRALVPGMLPNFPTAYRPLGGMNWIKKYSESVGWKKIPKSEEDINLLPLPYA